MDDFSDVGSESSPTKRGADDRPPIHDTRANPYQDMLAEERRRQQLNKKLPIGGGYRSARDRAADKNNPFLKPLKIPVQKQQARALRQASSGARSAPASKPKPTGKKTLLKPKPQSAVPKPSRNGAAAAPRRQPKPSVAEHEGSADDGGYSSAPLTTHRTRHSNGASSAPTRAITSMAQVASLPHDEREDVRILLDEKHTLLDQITDCTMRRRKLAANINKANAVRSRLDSEQARLRAKAHEYRDAAAKLHEARDEYYFLQNEIELRAADYQVLHQEYKLHEGNMRALDSAQVKGRKKFDQAFGQHRVKEENRTANALKKRLTDLENEIAVVQEKLDDLKSSPNDQGEQRNAAQRRGSVALETLQRDLDARREREISALQEQLAAQARDRQRQDEERESAERRLRAEANTKVAQLENAKEGKSKEAMEIRGRIDQLRNATSDLRKQASAKREILSAEEDDLKKAKSSNKRLEGELASLKRQLDDALKKDTTSFVSDQEAAWSKERSSLDAELKAHERRVGELKKEQAKLKQRKQAALKAIEDAASQASSGEKQEEADRAEVERLKKEALALRRESEKISQQAKDIEEEVEASQKDSVIAGLRQKISLREGERKALDASSKDLEKRLNTIVSFLKKNDIEID